MVSTNRPTGVVSVIASAVLVVALAGCTSGDDGASDVPSASASASASASPTESSTPADPAVAARQERIDDALRRYEEYLEIDEKHQKAGTNGLDELDSYLGHGDFIANEVMKWDFIAEHGYKMTGHRRVGPLVNAEYDGDPLADTISGHRVQLEVCVDGTDVDIVDADGKVVPVTDSSPKKSINSVLMQGQPYEQWAIVEDKPTEKAC